MIYLAIVVVVAIMYFIVADRITILHGLMKSRSAFMRSPVHRMLRRILIVFELIFLGVYLTWFYLQETITKPQGYLFFSIILIFTFMNLWIMVFNKRETASQYMLSPFLNVFMCWIIIYQL